MARIFEDIIVRSARDTTGNLLGIPLLPWIVPIDVFLPPTANVGWSTLTVSSLVIHNGYRQNAGGAQNAEVTWSLLLSAGTWTFSAMHLTSLNSGICTVNVDGVPAGTFDAYTPGSVVNVISSIAGIVISTSGQHLVNLIMATKNGASSGYYLSLIGAQMLRTA